MNFEKLTMQEMEPAVSALMRERYGYAIYKVLNPHFFRYTDDGAMYSMTIEKEVPDNKNTWRITTVVTFFVQGDGTLVGIQ